MSHGGLARPKLSARLDRRASAPGPCAGARGPFYNAAVGPRFELLAELGRGSFGAVLRAFDRQLGREVALKVIDVLAPEDVVRFAEEARALLRVQDPGVVRILDVDVTGDQPFLVMELVTGETLEARLRKGPLELREVARLGSEIARALAHLHAVGVVHRDLKPGNVVIRPDGQPVLLDLGMALLLDRSARLSRSGDVLGTPAFMSPEQAEGRTRDLGPATDVYGLGATLFALLTGRPPFEASTLAEAIDAVVHKRPPPPSSLRAELGTGLDRIVLACLAKDPLARPDLEQVRAALLALGQRGADAPPSTRHGALLVLAIALLALLALGLLGALLVGRREAEAPPHVAGPPPLTGQETPAGPHAAPPASPGPPEREGPGTGSPGLGSPEIGTATQAELRRQAEAGDTGAMIELGNAAYEGQGGPRDLAAAAAWYQRAAEAGDLEGITSLGSLYLTGQGVRRDPLEAARLLRSAAEQGNARAMCNLAAIYEDGAPGLPADPGLAAAWYRRSAEAGWSLGGYFLAVLSFEGRGVPQSDEEGLRWLHAASRGGHLRSTTWLAQLYEEGRRVERDPTMAARLRTQAAEQLQRQAAAGDAAAMVELGVVYARGRGVPRDPLAAARWWERAADHGDTSACYWLGVLYYDGVDVGRDLARARDSFARDVEPRTRAYAGLYLYLCALELGDEAAGAAALRDVRGAERDASSWTSEVAAALLGETSEEELLAAAPVAGDAQSTARRRCLANFYLGAQRLLGGDRARGLELLRACVATGASEYPQLGSAQALLRDGATGASAPQPR